MTLDREPAWDGLRALAILSVVAFHTGAPIAPAGSRGVDVFLVLSGFLITKILGSEHHQAGSVNLRAFYLRRWWRLGPELLIFLLYYAVLDPSILHRWTATVWRDVAIGAGQVMNLFCMEWGGFTDINHLWTLSLEVQFYLVWPFALLALLRLEAGLASWIIFGAWLALTVFRAIGTAIFDHTMLYYAPWFHCTGLLLGSGLALSGIRLKGGGLALVALAFSASAFNHNSSPSLAVGIPLSELAAAVAILDPPRFLRHPVIALYGRMSYGIYLWHLLIVWIIGPNYGWALTFKVLIASTIIGGLSYGFTLVRRLSPSNVSRAPTRRHLRLDYVLAIAAAWVRVTQ